jgi:hypothetical protein
MKNSNDTIGNETHDLLVCRTVPQTTAPPAACPRAYNVQSIIVSPLSLCTVYNCVPSLSLCTVYNCVPSLSMHNRKNTKPKGAFNSRTKHEVPAEE